jgi:outer membrane protein assembly factor BamB
VIGKALAFVFGEDLKVHAIDLKTRKEAWTSEGFKSAVLAMRVDGERLLAQSSTALVAMETGTGKQAWSLDLPGDTANERVINGMTIKMRVNVNGRPGAPGRGEQTFCVDDGIAYLPCGQKVWAVETKSGQKLWEYETQQDSPQGNSGINGGRVMVGGGGQIIINGNGRMIINGMTFGGGAGRNCQPVVAGSAIYYGGQDGLRAVDLRTRQETWVLHTGGAICTRPVVADGVIYFGVAAAPTMPPGMGAAVPAPAPDAVGQGEKLPALFAVKLPVK